MNSGQKVLIPYVLFAFVLGFAWFMLAPLVPGLASELHVSISAVLLFISMYGYAMVVGSIPAGVWTAKSGPAPVLTLAILLSSIGLLLRAFAHNYTLFLMAQIVAALAYPFLIAPIGSILRLSGVRRLKAGTGLTIGALFLGMGISALLSSNLGLSTALWLGFALNALIGIWLFFAVRSVPRPETGASSIRVRLTYSNWWIIGFVVSSTSVMIGGITSAALAHLHVAHAEILGGLLSGLTFIGSAVGAALFGVLGETTSRLKPLMVILAVFTWLSILWITLVLTGHVQNNSGLLSVVFFLAGAFGNGWYTLTLEEAAKRAENAGSAGLNTAGYSLASNIGVAIVPVILGPMVISQPTSWVSITLILGLLAILFTFITRTTRTH
ncbi:MFS transporter [Alicyclobacillus tolerans]|uniref:MFS transporter n=2 Tax=Alicyclobacillus TaxID=29330 RepID=UPI003B8247B8